MDIPNSLKDKAKDFDQEIKSDAAHAQAKTDEYEAKAKENYQDAVDALNEKRDEIGRRFREL